MPQLQFMYGTAWKEEQTEELTYQALRRGFRAVDTANQRKHYYEAGVGRALHRFLEETEAKRNDLFLQTKFTYRNGQDHRLPYDPKARLARQVEQSFDSSLDHLGVDYIDSLVLHGPYLHQGIAEEDREVWSAMEELFHAGKVKHLGVSNVSAEQLESLYAWAEVKPKFAQIRTYASSQWEKDIREFCAGSDIGFQGFNLITANRKFFTHAGIKRMSKKYQKTIPQIIFSACLSLGMVVLCGTSDQQHMEQTLSAASFSLTSAELGLIEHIGVI